MVGEASEPLHEYSSQNSTSKNKFEVISGMMRTKIETI